MVIAGLSVSACTGGSSSPGGGSSGSPSGDGVGPGDSSGSPDGDGPGAAGALPATTFLFVSRIADDRDVLVAYDRASGETRVVTDLRGDGSEGWKIDGYAISPDRTRIALTSLYGPTKDDVDTKLATNRIWTLAPDGSDFRRLTPVFENTGGGRTNFTIEIQGPIFSKSGANIFFGYGEYWWEGTNLRGGSGIWSVNAAGGELPTVFKNPSPCSLVDPSVDPSTGKVAILHSVCIPGQGQDGIYLHAEDGSGEPELLLARDYNSMDIVLETPRWAADGSGFVFIAASQVPDGNTTRMARGLYVFDMAERKAIPIVIPEDPDARVIDGTAAPDVSALVYCLQQGEATNLHLIDLSVDPPTDTQITNDGTSCHPVW